MYIIYLHSPRHNIVENKQQSKNKNVAHIFRILLGFVFFYFCLSSFSVPCARCYLYHLVAHFFLIFRFSVTIINTGNHKQCNVIAILCLRIYFYIVTDHIHIDIMDTCHIEYKEHIIETNIDLYHNSSIGF